MKGKAQKQSLKNFIHVIMNQTPQINEKDQSYFYITLKMCLIENLEPHFKDVISEKGDFILFF